MTEKPQIAQGKAMLTFLEQLSRGEVKAWAVTYIKDNGEATVIDETDIGWFALLGAMSLHEHMIRSKME